MSPGSLDRAHCRAGGGGSPGRTRTSDKSVNSRLLYQLSYAGSPHAEVSAE